MSLLAISVTFPTQVSLFNASLQMGQVPSEWKEANISPVPKAGDKGDVNNYRPISVIPIIAKFWICSGL